jgi:hypothetical protein
MQLYNCKVRLHGSLYNEVRKEDITAAEIAVLKAIHGQEGGIDPIADIEHTGRKNSSISEAWLRNYLTEEYGRGLAAIEGVKNLNGLFGVAGALPDKVQGVEHVTKAAYDARKAKAAQKHNTAPAAPDDLDIADDAEVKPKSKGKGAAASADEDEFA